MKRNAISLIIILIFALALSACTPTTTLPDNSKLETELKEKEAKITELENKLKDLEESNTPPTPTPTPTQNNLISRALDVMELIKAKDMNTLSTYIHPTSGVRFTPYFNIDMQTDQVFTAQQITGLMQNNQVVHWGEYDGSGDPIDLDFSDYYDRFIYDQDFVNPHLIGNNVAIGTGNIIDNIAQAYPNGHFTEFHFTGFDNQYEGIDWESLRLVFEDVGGIWYLVGIVHGQWTI